MTRTVLAAALLASLPLIALSSPMPTTPYLTKRDGPFYDGSNCKGDSVDVPSGWYFCFDSEGYNMSCDECNYASSSAGVSCYSSTGDSSSLGTRIACPSDPAPANMPDGSPNELADGLVGAFCDAQGGGGVFGAAASLGCFLYSELANGNDPVAAGNAGLTGICDTFFVGACTFFESGAGDVGSGTCTPTEENPDICDFAGPGK